MIGSRFGVQGSKVTTDGHGLLPKVIGSGFNGYKMLFSVVLYSIVWNGLFHPLGEKALYELFGGFSTLNRSTYAIDPL